MKKNIPNILTVSRIFMILIFVILASIADVQVLQDKSYVLGLRFIGYILSILAALTDLFDGYLARKFRVESSFGALMDPLADKIFVTGTMLMAVEYKLMPAWIAFAVLCREFMVTGLRLLAAKQQVVIAADRWGKLKTALQMVMLAIAGFVWVLEGSDWVRDGAIKCLREGSYYSVRLWYVWLTYLIGIVLVTVFSGLNYFIRYRKLYLPQDKGCNN